jgi:hypothetical protein
VREHNRKLKREKKKNPGKSKIEIIIQDYFLLSDCVEEYGIYLNRSQTPTQSSVFRRIPVQNMFNLVHD